MSDRQNELYRKLILTIRENADQIPCEDRAMLFDNVEGYESINRASALEAKFLCRNCPVRWLCLDYALEAKEPFGIWGGYTTEERKTLKKH